MAEENASAEKRPTDRGFANARLAILKRAKAVVLLPIVAGAAAWGIVSVIPNRYASMAVIQIEPGQLAPSAAEDANAPPDPPVFESEQRTIDTDLVALRSPQLLDAVISDLNLATDPEFKTRPLSARILSPFATALPSDVAREALAARLSIEQVRNSSLVNVRATSLDPAKAAAIANAIATRYIAQQRPALAHENPKQARPTSAEPTQSEKMFASLVDQYGFTRMLATARVVEEAHAARRPSGPKPIIVAATAAITTLILTLLIAVQLERDVQQRGKRVAQVLACPHMTSLPSLQWEDTQASARRARLIIAEPGCRYADAVRAVCNELSHRANPDEKPRVVMVASALAGEGAELFASNIAHYLAIAGHSTLLVDCDFADKMLTKQLAPASTAGLRDQIAAQAPIENVILRDGLTGLHFLPSSGPAPSPAAAGSGAEAPALTAAFETLKGRFPTIIVSAPPMLDAPDARVLADLADQIVFLTAWHRTPRALAKKAIAGLEANQRKVVGAVLADVSDDGEPGFMSFAAMFDEIRRATGFPSLARAA
jgi:succinoglycan biosynthesis transport protein ExoP